MITSQSQIKVNLPTNLKAFLQSKANRFGMPLAGYIKHLILKDVADMEYPVFEASEIAEKAYQQAVKAEEDGKLILVDNIDKFFQDL